MIEMNFVWYVITMALVVFVMIGITALLNKKERRENRAPSRVSVAGGSLLQQAEYMRLTNIDGATRPGIALYAVFTLSCVIMFWCLLEWTFSFTALAGAAFAAWAIYTYKKEFATQFFMILVLVLAVRAAFAAFPYEDSFLKILVLFLTMLLVAKLSGDWCEFLLYGGKYAKKEQ